MKKTVSMRDIKDVEIISLTVQGEDLETIKESCQRWGLVHNSINKDHSKEVYHFDIDGETYDIEEGE